MTMVQTIDTVQGTTYFCFDRDRRNVYTYIRESSGAKACGSIVRFEVKDGKLGKLEKLADLPSGMPCHIAISPDGSRLGFACYSSACVGTLSVDGGDVRYVVHDNSGLGTDRARQEKAHAHCSLFTPDGKFFGAVDLGKDAVLFYEPETMKTVPSMTVRLDPGDGPRHAVFSKDARHLFVLNELSNSVVSFAFDGCKFTRVGKWSTLPEGFGEWSKASAIKLTRDGSVIMASNRGYKRNSIAIYSVDAAKGTLTLRNIATVDGVFPRDFELSPDERFVIVGHKRSDEICMYRFDRASFALTPFGGRMKVFKPLCFGFFDTIR
jgi:6-phosphogluconolactonase